jgi:hypothetical protein
MGTFNSKSIVSTIFNTQSADSTPVPCNSTDIDKNDMKNMSWDWYIDHMRTNPVESGYMHRDIIAHGWLANGFHKDVPWEMRRAKSGGNSEHWCGYVLYDGNLTDDEYDLIEKKAHCGLTAHMGFDCAHCDDYTISNTRGVYRDYAYVLNCLQGMIDVLIETKSFNKQKSEIPLTTTAN